MVLPLGKHPGIILPDIHIHGCQFHYAQTIFRRFRILRLVKTYKKDGAVRQEVKKLFAFLLLPQRDMVNWFEEIEINADPRLSDLMTYMRATWFNSSVWKPVNLCSYQRLVRINNDVEGYHRRLNMRCITAHPPIYKLLEVIHSEARLVELTAKLVSSNAVGMTRSKKTTEKQARLNTLLDRYGSDHITISEFLVEASEYTPYWISSFGGR